MLKRGPGPARDRPYCPPRGGSSFQSARQADRLGNGNRAIGGRSRKCSPMLAETRHQYANVNIGGWVPEQSTRRGRSIERYAQAVTNALTRELGQPICRNHRSRPGRSLVGDAGLIQSEVT